MGKTVPGDVTLVCFSRQYEISVLEEKMKLMKPNLSAIAEYRKKVSCKYFFVLPDVAVDVDVDVDVAVVVCCLVPSGVITIYCIGEETVVQAFCRACLSSEAYNHVATVHLLHAILLLLLATQWRHEAISSRDIALMSKSRSFTLSLPS